MPDEQVSLRDYVERMVHAHEKLNETRLCSIEKAIKLAADQMDKRLEGMNEFRAQLTTYETKLVTRQEAVLVHEKLEADLVNLDEKTSSDIRSLRESRAVLEGKASQQSVNTAMLISVSGLILSMLTIILHVAKII